MNVNEMLEYDKRRFSEDEVNPSRLLSLGFTHGADGVRVEWLAFLRLRPTFVAKGRPYPLAGALGIARASA